MTSIIITIIIVGVVIIWFLYYTSPKKAREYSQKLIESMNKTHKEEYIKQYGEQKWQELEAQSEKFGELFKNADWTELNKQFGLEESKKRFTLKNIIIGILAAGLLFIIIHRIVNYILING